MEDRESGRGTESKSGGKSDRESARMSARKQAKKRAKELVEQMTLFEKAAQLKYDAAPVERLGVPAYNWWSEALHGVARAGSATMFPQAIGMAATFDEKLVEEAGVVASTEGRAKYNEFSAHGDRDIYKGLTFWSPNVNIFRDPRWGRGQETYGEDPYLTARLGMAYVRGIQGEGPVMRAAACAKHFAVHSGPESLRHEFDARVSQKDLWETYLPAFEALVREAGVEAVMGAYNRINGEPCCGSTTLIRDILRGKWGFEGHFVSDCWAIRDFHEHHGVTSDAEESAAMALRAGCDLNCGSTYLHVYKACQDGLVTEEEITEAAERLFTTRFLLGLFDETEYDGLDYSLVECREHLELALQAARESLVLLKNDGVLPLCCSNDGVLPLRGSNDGVLALCGLKPGIIGVIGPNADSREALKGNYCGASSRYITVLEGIQDEAGENVRVMYAEGCHLWKEKTEGLSFRQNRLSEAEIVAEHSDVVVLCLGLDATMEGEQGDTGNSEAAGDKLDLNLPQVQRELLERVAAVGKPVILVLMSGSAVDISYAKEHCAAILLAWYPGALGGRAVAEALFGRFSPSGKLPVTFYRNEDLDWMPPFEEYAMKGRTYRYLEREPLYPFGYGLTYGDCRVVTAEAVKGSAGIEIARMTRERAAEEPDIENHGPAFTLRAVLKNRSAVDTKEVLQVYIEHADSLVAPPNPSLCAFRRVFLKGGEQIEVELEIPARAFSVVDESGERIYEGGRFCLHVGFGQPDRTTRELVGDSGVQVWVELS